MSDDDTATIARLIADACREIDALHAEHERVLAELVRQLAEFESINAERGGKRGN